MNIRDAVNGRADVNSPMGDGLIQNIDAADADTTYVGRAVPGTAAGDAAWQVKKILVVGTLTTIRFLNGSTAFDQVWTGFASGTYS